MPSRKSNISTTSNGAAEEDSPVAGRARRDSTGMSVEDLSLPRTMISRLSKGVLPPNTQIQKDALTALSKCSTVFVNFIASNAMDNATGSGKKTIQPTDVLVALKDSEFEFMIPRIEAELKKYNTVQCDKRNSYRRKVKADKAATTPSSGPLTSTDPNNATTTTAENSLAGSPTSATNPSKPSASNGKANNDDVEDRPSKKIRLENEDDEDEDDEGAEDAAEDDEGEVDEDEEMEEEEEDDEVEEDEVGDEDGEGEEREDEDEDDEDARIQRQIERDEALDEGGESD